MVRGGLIALGALFAALGGLLVWVHTASGRGFVARRIESAVTSRIQGALHIATITRISMRGVSAHDVRFTAPGGGDVIVVDDVDLEIRWWPLLRGRLVSPKATAKGGRVVLRDERGGDLSIEVAMRGRTPAPPNAQRSERGDRDVYTIDLQRIDVSDVTLVATVGGVPDARVSNVQGALTLRVRDTDGELLLKLDDLAGSGHLDTPVPISMRLTGGTFRFDSASSDRVHADARAVLGDNRVRVVCNARVRGDDTHIAVRLTLPSSAGALDSLPAIAQATALDLTSSSFDFTLVRN